MSGKDAIALAAPVPATQATNNVFGYNSEFLFRFAIGDVGHASHGTSPWEACRLPLT
jgi:hypothetical protein